jgi:hypothetical protein
VRTGAAKNLATKKLGRSAREEGSHRPVPVDFLAGTDSGGAAIEASEREAQTDPRRHKVILRLIYNIVSDV